jgi:hypothetical protein
MLGLLENIPHPPTQLLQQEEDP